MFVKFGFFCGLMVFFRVYYRIKLEVVFFIGYVGGLIKLLGFFGGLLLIFVLLSRVENLFLGC